MKRPRIENSKDQQDLINSARELNISFHNQELVDYYQHKEIWENILSEEKIPNPIADQEAQLSSKAIFRMINDIGDSLKGFFLKNANRPLNVLKSAQDVAPNGQVKSEKSIQQNEEKLTEGEERIQESFIKIAREVYSNPNSNSFERGISKPFIEFDRERQKNLESSQSELKTENKENDLISMEDILRIYTKLEIRKVDHDLRHYEVSMDDYLDHLFLSEDVYEDICNREMKEHADAMWDDSSPAGRTCMGCRKVIPIDQDLNGGVCEFCAGLSDEWTGDDENYGYDPPKKDPDWDDPDVKLPGIDF